MVNNLKPQSQASLYDQLIELYNIANCNGLYDAADWIKITIDDIYGKSVKENDNEKLNK